MNLDRYAWSDPTILYRLVLAGAKHLPAWNNLYEDKLRRAILTMQKATMFPADSIYVKMGSQAVEIIEPPQTRAGLPWQAFLPNKFGYIGSRPPHSLIWIWCYQENYVNLDDCDQFAAGAT